MPRTASRLLLLLAKAIKAIWSVFTDFWNTSTEVWGTADEGSFVTTWETTTPSETITLPLVAGGTYNFTVKWGDGTIDTITAYNQAEVTHTYATAGTYTVTIAGTIEGFRFNNAGDKTKIKTIESYGSLVITTSTAFYGCSNLTSTATDAPTITATSLIATFTNCTNFNGAIGNWDVSGVTNLQSMFQGASSFNQDISGWDVSSVTTMASMFLSASSFNQDISSWNVSNVTIMSGMFYVATSFNQNLSNWDVSSVTTMENMFRNCISMSAANLGAIKDWIITDLTNGANMMNACTNSMSTSDYDALLIAWANQAPSIQNNVAIHFNAATYTAGGAAAAARTTLTTATPTGYGWTITDGGTA